MSGFILGVFPFLVGGFFTLLMKNIYKTKRINRLIDDNAKYSKSIRKLSMALSQNGNVMIIRRVPENDELLIEPYNPPKPLRDRPAWSKALRLHSKQSVDAAFKRGTKSSHADAGGSDEKMRYLIAARDAAYKQGGWKR